MGQGITVENVHKRFGDFVALDDVSLTVPGRRADRAAGPQRQRQVDAAAGDRWAGDARPRHRAHRRPRHHQPARPAPRRRLRVPALRGVQAHDRAPEHRLRAEHPQAPQGRDRRQGGRAAGAGAPGGVRPSLPVAAVGGPAPAHGPGSGAGGGAHVLLLDEPFGALDANVRQELREWLRRLHDMVHVTTIFVTHDQEEAMEVAEQIVVMDHGTIEQVGAPRELYEQPVSEFVMRFVGPVSQWGDRWCARTTSTSCRSPDGRRGGNGRARGAPGLRGQGRVSLATGASCRCRSRVPRPTSWSWRSGRSSTCALTPVGTRAGLLRLRVRGDPDDALDRRTRWRRRPPEAEPDRSPGSSRPRWPSRQRGCRPGLGGLGLQRPGVSAWDGVTTRAPSRATPRPGWQ